MRRWGALLVVGVAMAASSGVAHASLAYVTNYAGGQFLTYSAASGERNVVTLARAAVPAMPTMATFVVTDPGASIRSLSQCTTLAQSVALCRYVHGFTIYVNVTLEDGNDTFAAAPGSAVGAQGAYVNGGYGNDVLIGASGNDRFEPGPGTDKVNTGGGADFVYARDGVKDRIDCGGGYDYFAADSFDAVSNCEHGLS